MKKQILAKQLEPRYNTHPEVIGELEFSQAADVLLEAIYQYFKRRDGVDLKHDQAVAIAVEVLESRG